MLNCLCTVSIKNTVANFSFSFYQEYCTLEIFKAGKFCVLSLLKILLQIFLSVSIKSTVHWTLSRQINFFVLSLLKILFSIFQKNSIFNRKKSPWKVKCTVRLIESTEYLHPDTLTCIVLKSMYLSELNMTSVQW